MLGIWPLHRTDLPAPEHGDDGESRCPFPPVPRDLDFNKDICKYVFQPCWNSSQPFSGDVVNRPKPGFMSFIS